jgi:hypothetical protein
MLFYVSNNLHDIFCQGLVPRVPQAINYGLKIGIRLVPSSGKRLGNQTPHTRYGLTTPG